MTTKLDLPTFGAMSATDVVKAPWMYVKAMAYVYITLPVAMIDPIMEQVRFAAETAYSLTRDANIAARAAVIEFERQAKINHDKSMEENAEAMARVFHSWFK